MLPFTDALTFRWLGIPVKVYEIASALILGLIFIKYELTRKVKLEFPLPLLVFVLWGVAATLIASLYPELYKYGYLWGGRDNVLVSMTTRIMYAFYFVFAFSLFTYILDKYGIRKVLKIFLVSAMIVTVYHAFNFFTSLFAEKVFLLPNSSEQYVNLPFGRTLRNGVFHEGNYVGLYYLFAIMFSEYYAQKYLRLTRLKYLFIFGLIITFSTINYLGLILFYAIKLYQSGKRFKLFRMVVMAALIVMFVPPFNGIILKKIVGVNQPENYSRNERLRNVAVAVQIFEKKPLTGIGLGNYGYYFPYYSKLGLKGKVVPGNVYASIIAETGIFGIMLFLFFIYYCFSNIKKIRDEAARIHFYAGLVSILFVYNAFPSYEITFLNLYFALICRYHRIEQGNNEKHIIL